MNYFLITFQQVAELFLIILVGALAYKTGVVRGEVKKDLSNILINLVIPAIILYSFQTQMELSKLSVLGEAFFLCALAHILLILGSRLFLPARSSADYAIERICTVFTNAGFMGLPLLGALFGAEGTFFASVYVAVFHLFLWTYGAFSLSKENSVRQSLKQLCSPTIAAVVLSLILFFADIKLPEVLLAPTGYLADLNTPLAMLATGVSLASCRLSDFFRSGRIYYMTALRLCVLPALLLVCFRLLGYTDTAGICVLVAAACPTGALAPMVALRYGHNEQISSGVFAVSTLLSLFSIPVFMLFVR